MRRAALIALASAGVGPVSVALLPACAPVEPAAGPNAPSASLPAEVPTPSDSAEPLPPPGFGSLRQDEISLDIVDGELNVKITPLAEAITRLAAPDTYERLHALAVSRAPTAMSLTEAVDAEMFLVSFFSREPNVEYRPEELQLSHRGRLQRPAGILPLTTGWGRQLLQPQETQSAIYVFEPPFDYQLPLTVRYGTLQSDDWHRVVLERIEEERTRVLSRAGTASRPHHQR
jgi:hypothetical protein